jgi:nucleotide-binding universal stress UspA family protein
MLPQTKRILYATDLSPNSGYALRYALGEAKKHEACLVILHVIEKHAPMAMALAEPLLGGEAFWTLSEENKSFARARVLNRLQHICKQEQGSDPDIDERIEAIEVAQGHAPDLILSKAEAFDCDVILMGTHGKGFFRKTHFGSTSRHVLRRARKPVFIVPLPVGEIDITIHDQ